jgi:hypothetical protein
MCLQPAYLQQGSSVCSAWVLPGAIHMLSPLLTVVLLLLLLLLLSPVLRFASTE